jgi:Flp pilus assembly protein TadB
MLSIAVLTAAVAAVLATWQPSRSTLRVTRVGSVWGPARPARPVRRRWWSTPWVVVGGAGLATTQLIGGVTGLLAGAAVGVAAHRWIATAEPAALRRQRSEQRRDLPLAVDLLVACVTAGLSPSAAVAVVADVLPGSLGARFRSVTARLALGADPELVWRDLAADPALGPLGNALARSARTGGSITTALARCADDLRRERRANAATVARSVGVRAAAPLGACFLPAFLLIGVVPTIVGAFGTLAG